MVDSNGAFVCNGGVNEDGGEKGGVFVGHKRRNDAKTESLSPEIDGENGEWDVFRCHEAANKRIRLAPKENEREAAMAEILLNLKPIGLGLQNLPYLLNTIQKNYSNSHAKVDEHHHYSPQQQIMTEKEKLKASNFTATLLRIGCWERVTRNEGDLVAKCYYAKKKLVWEFLERGLKSKIEIQWSDILAIRADIQENKPGILEIELSKPPTFHDETDPQPRKHTIWRLTTDFTGGEASKWRRHYLRFPPGSLDKHYEKLLQCDSRLLALSQQRFPSLKSPIFESNSCGYGFSGFNLDFNGRGVLHMNHPEMHWPIPRFPRQDFVQNQLHYQSFSKPNPLSFHEMPSPISVMDLSHSDELGGNTAFENSRMALWSGNNAYQGLPGPTYHLQRCRPDQTFAMNEIQGIESVVSSTMPLDRSTPFNQNYRVPYDQAMEISQVELLDELQDQLLSERSQVSDYDNNYHLARMASLNALVDLAKEQKGNNTSESDQTLNGMQDLYTEEALDLSFEDASDPFGSGFEQLFNQQQQIVTSNVTTQLSSNHHQLPWSNSATYASPGEGYDHHENTLDGVNRWS